MTASSASPQEQFPLPGNNPGGLPQSGEYARVLDLGKFRNDGTVQIVPPSAGEADLPRMVISSRDVVTPAPPELVEPATRVERAAHSIRGVLGLNPLPPVRHAPRDAAHGMAQRARDIDNLRRKW